MRDEAKRAMIERYLAAYNALDVEGMMETVHPDIEFSNIANGEVNARTSGAVAFRALAEQSSKVFASRKLTMTGFEAAGDVANISVDFHGVLAADLPDGRRRGETITLSGRSVFVFCDGKLSKITDIS
ncbi:nuclear transport factor 2 family protein [Solidesulfovibrio sp.]|uniref:nuclear transport factor 2 family protein n=1 Tax=Solidesulfovibrio sp. TaxID=2910990 RepID=UPI002B21D507|nr:nuclear transport factor 2 family protein [Solidesulfovibrio sp.]MEA5090220.1 nuclear transport factor 2 family protein [Solidesulfovibrio sp.]